jgi:hypothetical protein
VGLLNPHLDDTAFADLWADRLTLGSEAESGRSVATHLRACAECRARYAAFSTWLETMRTDAYAEAEGAFSVERLTGQQAQIFRRLEGLEHPAKVIAFPKFARPISSAPTGRQRWVAAAAAAGLIVGVGLGQVLEFRGASVVAPDARSQPQQQIAARGVSVLEGRFSVQPASQISDETFLYEQELVPSQVRVPESLQYLNAITPGARDVEPR